MVFEAKMPICKKTLTKIMFTLCKNSLYDVISCKRFDNILLWKMSFQGLPFENNGENLCYCNSGANALLSCQNITSRVNPEHCPSCDSCDFLFGMTNATSPAIKSALSAKPLKKFVARFKPQFNSNKQQVGWSITLKTQKTKLLQAWFNTF